MTTPERLSLPDGRGGWVNVTVSRPVDGAWSPVIGRSAAPLPPFVPDTGPVMSVAGQLAAVTHNFSPSTGLAVGTVHSLHTNAASLTLAWVIRTESPTKGTAPVTFRAWVRSKRTAWRPVLFKGVPEATITPPDQSTNLYADPLEGPWYAHEPLSLIVWATSTGVAPASHMATTSSDLGMAPATPGEATTAQLKPGKTWTLRPALVLAPAALKASWLAVGDSIWAQSADCYGMQAARLRYQPATLAAQGGSHAGSVNSDAGFALRMGEQVKYVDSVLWQYGVNNSDPIPTVAVWERIRARGVKRIVACTLLPSTSSTDGFATLAGQSITRPAAQTYNAWLRDGAPVKAGAPVPAGTAGADVLRATVVKADGTVIRGSATHPLGSGWVSDVGEICESSPGSGLWRVDKPGIPGGNDGLHPQQPAHDLAATRLARDLALMGF